MQTNSPKSGIVLGLNLSHDRSACVVIDGQVRVAIAEERLSRLKHDIPLNKFGENYCQCPLEAIEYCLDAVSCTMSDVDLVVASTTYVLDVTTGRRRPLTAQDVVRQCQGLSVDRVHILNHHLAHAVSAGWCSGFEDAAILVVDGGGSIVGFDRDGAPADFERTTIYNMRNRNLTMVRRSTGGPPGYGNSIGDFYQLITRYLGFRAGEEGKLMGLAAYGQPPLVPTGKSRSRSEWKPLAQFENAIVVNADGTHDISPAFQLSPTDIFPEQLIAWYGPPRLEVRPDDEFDRQIAASAQWALEWAMIDLCHIARQETGAARLCLAGGVALNCVANGRILREGLFDDLFIQPASTDDGTALGNALWGWRLLTGEPPDAPGWSAYLGTPYSTDEINFALRRFDQRITVNCSDDLAADVADSIAEGLIVGMFRGGSEFGPRALGHRSIFCDPRRAHMQDHLNTQVKHREPFRPFAPIVLEDRAGDFFELKAPSPYMLLAAPVIYPERIPAVTHVDGTARIQTVNDRQEPFLCELLRAFGDRTGIPVILNTSFNLAGEPIVESPDDALRCLLSTGIDILYLENFRVTRRN